MCDMVSIVFIMVLQSKLKRLRNALPTEMVKVIVMVILTWRLVLPLARSVLKLGERLKCGTAEVKRAERSELAVLNAVATTGLFALICN